MAFFSGNIYKSTPDYRPISYANHLNLQFPKAGLSHLLQATKITPSIPRKGLRLVGSTVEVSGGDDVAYGQWHQFQISYDFTFGTYMTVSGTGFLKCVATEAFLSGKSSL